MAGPLRQADSVSATDAVAMRLPGREVEQARILAHAAGHGPVFGLTTGSARRLRGLRDGPGYCRQPVQGVVADVPSIRDRQADGRFHPRQVRRRWQLRSRAGGDRRLLPWAKTATRSRAGDLPLRFAMAAQWVGRALSSKVVSCRHKVLSRSGGHSDRTRWSRPEPPG